MHQPQQREKVFRRRTEIPSFSSTLLDDIYRSTGGSNGGEKELKNGADGSNGGGFSMKGRSCMVEKWIERDFSSRRKAAVDSNRNPNRKQFVSSSSTSPESMSASGFSSSKPKKLKICSQLKKMKQPLSPGGRLSRLLGALFSVGNPKTSPKMGSSCSSLSRAPSSYDNGGKRAVRFYPLTLLLDEQTKPCRCGHKKVAESQRDEEMKDLLKSLSVKGRVEDKMESEEDDESCASSDLFELENLWSIEELPVYGTTNIGTNAAIARGILG